MRPDVRVCSDIEELSLQAGEAAVRTVGEATRLRGRCSLVLAGGCTPRTLYRLLALGFAPGIPWPRIHVFWGDERYVPHSDMDSNYRLAKEMLLDHVPCPSSNVHPMPTHFSSPDAAAEDYESTLRTFFRGDRPRFDLVLLGLGPDGHTASLFPGSPVLAESTRWVRAVRVTDIPPTRLTLTWPALIPANNIFVLVSGSNKASALRQVLGDAPDERQYPAARIRMVDGSVIWWVDKEAVEGQLQ